jgi:hypothetical protein
MFDYKEDTDHNFRAVFFLSLFFLLFLVSSNSQGNNSSGRSSVPNPAAAANAHDAAIINATELSGIQKLSAGTSCNTSFNAFSILNKINCYNQRIADCLLTVQKLRLSIIPLASSRVYLHHFPDEDKDPPALG